MPAQVTLESVLQDEVATLEAIRVVLRDETTALARLDYPSIDRARERKDNYDERLRELVARRPSQGTISPDLKARHLDLCREVARQARDNRIRLEACYAGIRGLLAELTGQTTATYAPKRRTSPAAAPVLTSNVE